MERFRDRHDAGLRLAALLKDYAAEDPVVLALPRGGVPVAYEVARALGAALDVWVVRKLGVPWHPELGVGAVAEGGYVYVARSIAERVGLSEPELEDLIAEKRLEVEERVELLRGERAGPDLRGRTAILIDDGIATGGTVRAAIRSVRAAGARRVILAVPVAAAETLADLAGDTDRAISLLLPRDLYAIGLWYQDFQQVADHEAIRLLEHARGGKPRSDHVVA